MRAVPPDGGSQREVATALNQVIQGRNNANGSVTLTASAATTAVSDDSISGDATVLLTPRTANAAAEQAAGTLYLSAIANGSFTLTHANNAQSDRTFDYLVLGG